MSAYLSVHICMHVTYTNKILDNERVMTFPMRYSLASEHKKHIEITGQRDWTCVKLQCPCVRLRLDDVSTHSGVNS